MTRHAWPLFAMLIPDSRILSTQGSGQPRPEPFFDASRIDITGPGY